MFCAGVHSVIEIVGWLRQLNVSVSVLVKTVILRTVVIFLRFGMVLQFFLLFTERLWVNDIGDNFKLS
jgi:hypothetical protein